MKFIIIGCGRWGAGLAQALVQHHHAVTIIDSDHAAFGRLGTSFRGQTLVGIGFDREVLLQAGIEQADGLAAVTASDEVNVVTARMARQFFHVPKVVARLYDSQKAEIYQRFGLQTISTVSWGVNRLAELLGYSDLDVIASLGDGGVDIAEMEVPPLWVGQIVNQLMIAATMQVIALTRAGHTFVPAPGLMLQTGDRMHLALAANSAERVKAMLGMK